MMSGTQRVKNADGRRLGVVARAFCAAVGALGVLVILAGSVSAAAGPAGQSLSVSPSTVQRGHSVTITGVAPSCRTVTLLSDAFPSTNEFAGVPSVNAVSTAGGHFHATVTIPASRAPGVYTISARACGGNLGVAVTLTLTTGMSVPATGASIGTQLVLGVLLVLAGMSVLALWVSQSAPSVSRRRPS
jgi:hypothetical protein